jgi:hypothetical protein
MRAPSRLAPLLGAPFLIAALIGASAAPAESATSVTPVLTPTPSVTSIPAAVQPLIAKIEALAVNSERYTVTTHASGTKTVKLSGGKRRKVSKSATTSTAGEASLAPLVAKLYKKGSSGQLSSVAVGSQVYIYAPSPKRKRRPWLRLGGVSAATLFPFHGQSNPAVEVNAGGTGTYDELIDLLASANGAVAVVGPAVVDGQQTTELKATVRPLSLIQGTTSKQSAELPEQLEAFVTEAGLPVRVIRSERFEGISVSETTDVLATNVPVTVKAPPARKTISGTKVLKGAPGAGGNSGTGLGA